LQEQIDILDSSVINPEAIELLNKTKSETEELRSTVESLFKFYDDEIHIKWKVRSGNHEKLIRKLD